MSPNASNVSPQPGEVTVLLRQIRNGDAEARGEFFALVYPDLKRLANLQMGRERRDHTLQPTALISELFLSIHNAKDIQWRDRAHFLAIASQMMKRYLIDYARARGAERRGGGQRAVFMDGLEFSAKPMDLLELTELLDRLAAEEPRMGRVVDLRCFGGLTHVEIAETLGVDERTCKRDWQVARAWLQAQLAKRPSTHVK